jgi:D-alanyl-lipoteichoic acid acyltransferase DltB (MBOAT superfamily)
MWFNSFSFLWFFPLVLAVYYAIPAWRGRKFFLLVASYFFYACWNPPFVLLLIGSSAWDYTVGRGLEIARSPLRRKLLVAASCITNFGVLVVFKYSGLLLTTWQQLCRVAGLPWPATPAWVTHVVLPVGISFYTFHGVSYVIDVYRGRVEPEHSLLDFMLFVAFFPQLVAGPILRAWYFVPQLHTKRENRQLDWLRGGYLIVLGLFQKMALADNIAPLANLVFDNPGKCNTAELWLGTYAFAFQIYFDFAGYSNIAIGCARLLGFEIPENFRVPYIAAGFREFWRRWHISLSTWLRDYLYIPLGGNRGSTLLTIRNLFIVMALGGLWHGANWTFVVWGVLHGAYLAAEHLLQPLLRRVPERVRASPITRALAVIVTFHLTCIAWVFFRAPAVGTAASMVTEMLLPSILQLNIATAATPYVVISAIAVVIALLVKGRGVSERVPGWAWGVTAALMLAVTIVSWGDPNAFIYFRF